MNRVIVTRSVLGFAAMQVCAVPDATDEEIIDVCNRENPSGTELGWTDVDRSERRPVQCADNNDRLHFIVTC